MRWICPKDFCQDSPNIVPGNHVLAPRSLLVFLAYMFNQPFCRVKEHGGSMASYFLNCYFQGGLKKLKKSIQIPHDYNMISHPEEPYMGVSKNNGTPKSSILIWFSIIFTIHFGVPLLYQNQPFPPKTRSPVGWGHQWQSQRFHLPNEARDLKKKTREFSVDEMASCFYPKRFDCNHFLFQNLKMMKTNGYGVKMKGTKEKKHAKFITILGGVFKRNES